MKSKWLILLVGLFAGLLGGCSDDQRDTQVLSRVHFNTNVSDFAVSRAFYGKLGFETVSGFPDANTVAMAQAIGITTPTSYDGAQGGEAGGYLLHGELIGTGFSGGLIDLIEFSIPRNDAAPYARINRLGMTHAEMLTTDIDADYQYMLGQGVEFLHAPLTSADGSRFAFFKDPDGVFYKLKAIAGEVEATETTHIQRLGAVTINVSDFERAKAWYGLLGFEQVATLPATESSAVAAAMGFAEPIEIRGGRFRHVHDGNEIELIQWLAPFDPTPPYPAPINHIGIHRMAFSTSDIAADVAFLEAQGVRMISPITPCCSGPDSWGGIVAFYDPDGTIMELVEQPMMTVMGWFSGL